MQARRRPVVITRWMSASRRWCEKRIISVAPFHAKNDPRQARDKERESCGNSKREMRVCFRRSPYAPLRSTAELPSTARYGFKTIILPRQAWDKVKDHGNVEQNGRRFLQACADKHRAAVTEGCGTWSDADGSGAETHLSCTVL